MAPQTPIGFARLVQFLVECARKRFNGHVSILFRDGSIVTVRREETWIDDRIPVEDEQSVQILENGRPLERVSA